MKKFNKIISFYEIIWKAKLPPKPLNSLSAFSSFMSIRGDDISAFIAHCRDLALSIVKRGTTVAVTDTSLRRRESLNLPTSKFNKVDINKMATITGLSKILEESK